MKKVIVLLPFLLLFLNYQIFSQDTTATTIVITPSLYSDSSEVLTEAVGWAFNEKMNEWIDYDNVISTDKSFQSKNKVSQISFLKSISTQNFISMYCKTLDIDSEKYYILFIEKYYGYFKDPETEEDWIESTCREAYVFDKEEYSKLHSIGGPTEVTTNLRFYGFIDEKLVANIKKEIQNPSGYYTTPYTFKLKKTPDLYMNFFVPDETIKVEKLSFSTEYFEIPYDTFMTIIIRK